MIKQIGETDVEFAERVERNRRHNSAFRAREMEIFALKPELKHVVESLGLDSPEDLARARHVWSDTFISPVWPADAARLGLDDDAAFGPCPHLMRLEVPLFDRNYDPMDLVHRVHRVFKKEDVKIQLACEFFESVRDECCDRDVYVLVLKVVFRMENLLSEVQ